jgi:hypothetical protein
VSFIEEGVTVKNKFLALILLAFGSSAFGQVSIGISIGPPPPPRVIQVRPSSPGPEFVWVEGYWYPVGNHYKWHSGYWTRPVYPGGRWIAPRYEADRFYNGYWDGDRGRFDHDHHWDRDRYRDYRDRDRDRGRGHDRH